MFAPITLAASLLFAAGPAAAPFADLNDSGLASVILTPALYESSLAKLEPLFTGDLQAFAAVVLAQTLPGTEGAEANRMVDLDEASWHGRTPVLQLSV